MNHKRYGYFFGYGADREPDMINAIIGHQPKYITKALLHNYELHIQDLSEIKSSGDNPQQRLRNCWGDDFKSYVILPKPGALVEGSLFKISIHERHLIDTWELVQLGWYKRIFVTVVGSDGQKYRAETQVLEHDQNAAIISDGLHYRSWLQPKRLFMNIARKDSKS